MIRAQTRPIISSEFSILGIRLKVYLRPNYAQNRDKIHLHNFFRVLIFLFFFLSIFYLFIFLYYSYDIF